MKLSMWIIKDWLSEYDPVAIITDGQQNIEGIRFFTESVIQQERYVYISRVKDVFPHYTSNEVLLIHGNDTISLKSEDLEDVFNITLAAFEFFNSWEHRLNEKAKGERPEQGIIDVCEELFGPMFIMDINYNLLAFSQRFKMHEVNLIWDDFLTMSNPSLKTIRIVKASTFSRLLFRKNDMQIYEELHAAPYSYGLMNSYLDDDGELIGQLAIASDTPITQREVQLAKSIRIALDNIPHKPEVGGANSLFESVLKRLLLSDDIDELDLQKFLIALNWEENDTYFIVQASSPDSDNSALAGYKDKLAFMINESVFTLHNGVIIGIVLSSYQEKLVGILLPAARDAQLHVGISNCFTNIREVSLFAKQARDALQSSEMSDRKVTCFFDCGLHAITHSDDRGYVGRSLHPAVIFLREYDEAHNTEFSHTLRVFLQNERSHVAAAECLFVHRNTILYRINKILELTSIDLGNPYEREYILTSFRMLD